MPVCVGEMGSWLGGVQPGGGPSEIHDGSLRGSHQGQAGAAAGRLKDGLRSAAKVSRVVLMVCMLVIVVMERVIDSWMTVPGVFDGAGY